MGCIHIVEKLDGVNENGKKCARAMQRLLLLVYQERVLDDRTRYNPSLFSDVRVLGLVRNFGFGPKCL